MLKIIHFPHPALRMPCEKISDPTNPAIKKLIADMLECLRAHKGLGLAAPQIGQNLQLCIIELEHELFVLINPEIKSLWGDKIIMEEGCLSFPGKFLPVARYDKIKVKAVDTNGKIQILRAKGLLSRAIQHEIDHLGGKLFIDRAEEEKRLLE